MTQSDTFDLFSIGHSNHPIDRFIGLLKSAAITTIADVRSRPFSRRFRWFSQNRLAETPAGEGIAYMSFGDSLGGRPDDASLFREGIVDFEALAATPVFKAGLARAVAASRGQRFCLMCAEKEPLDCHRCLLVARALAADGIRVGHILADTSVEPHTATEDRLLATTRTGADLFTDSRRERLAEAFRRRTKAAGFRAK
jgi:uncharacterized protein (DUF488 family)